MSKKKGGQNQNKTTTKERRITDRQKLFVDYLPEYQWDYFNAAIAAGFSQHYARGSIHSLVKRHKGLQGLISEKRAEITAGSEDRREKRLRQLDLLADDPRSSSATVLKAIDLQGKMLGWHSNTVALERHDRQTELDSARQAEIDRLLVYRAGALPDDRLIPRNVTYEDIQQANRQQDSPRPPKTDDRPADGDNMPSDLDNTGDT